MKINSLAKYRPYPFRVDLEERDWPRKKIVCAPIWCSVDLRDGNQALALPMNIEEKLVFYKLLLELGFKQIEIGFPSASQIEFDFTRKLVEEDLIPEGIYPQALVQAREHLIKRTFESLRGAPRAIVHMYNSTSPLQRRVTFNNASREEIKNIAIKGAKLTRKLADKHGEEKFAFEYSPESFSDTEVEFALDVCHAVMEIWRASEQNKIILNLPVTVEWTTPNVHADQIEWFCKNLQDRDSAIVSLHTHNDRGTGVACAELGLLAGADRVEGTLFGNGERTGNLDIITLALNMNSHGIETGLDFSDIPRIRKIYEECTRMSIHPRHPYSGDLVFTAFSGSHQDAIKKGFDLRGGAEDREKTKWQVPYLSIDPRDIGRNYKAIIRINSQSGKGGVAYILERFFGFKIPKSMAPAVGKVINVKADELRRELSNNEINTFFRQNFVNLESPLHMLAHKLDFKQNDKVACKAEISLRGERMGIEGSGNGPINAFVHALEEAGVKDFHVNDYFSHAISRGSDSDSASYVQIDKGGELYWGCGLDSSIEKAGLKALISAFNVSEKE